MKMKVRDSLGRGRTDHQNLEGRGRVRERWGTPLWRYCGWHLSYLDSALTEKMHCVFSGPRDLYLWNDGGFHKWKKKDPLSRNILYKTSKCCTFLLAVYDFSNVPITGILLEQGNMLNSWYLFAKRFFQRQTTDSMCIFLHFSSVQFSSVAQPCLTLCDPKNHSTPGLPVHHQLLEFTQTHAHRVGDAIQPSHPLSPSSPAPNPSQHQGLFQWVNPSREVSKVLEFQLQHQSFQWTPRTDFL